MMKKWIALVLSAIMVLSICGCGKTETPAAQEAQTQIVETVDITGKFAIGFGRMDISPKEAVPISGITANGTDRMSTSIHDTLYVSCIAMTDENGDTRLLMSWDLQGSYAEVLDSIRTLISQDVNVPLENITLTAIHTHSGPAVRDNTVAYMAEYRTMLGVQCIEAARAAMADRKPAEVYYSQVEVEGMNSIRHYTNELEDGSLIYWGDQYRVGTCSVNTTTKHVAEPDRTMYIIRFQREGDKDVVLANWRAHPHLFTSSSSYRVSADFIGAFRTAAEAYYDCYFTYFQGAAGNVNATSKISGELKTKDYGEYGHIMAEYMLQAMENETKVETTTIQSRQNQRVFEQNHTTDHLVAYATVCRRMWQTGSSNAEATAYGEPYGVYGPVAAASIISRAKKGATITSELNAFAIGDQICFVTAPHELFDTNSVWLEGQSPYDVTLTFGYTNAMNGYVPSAAAFEYGCYEANCTNLMPGGGELIQEEFLVMLNDMFK